MKIKRESISYPPTPPQENSSPPSTWPYCALMRNSASVAPSQLVLTGLVKPRGPPSPDESLNGEPPRKRVRRKARTEEERKVREDERAMRNRRAAQESRDRRKKQMEMLEVDNGRLKSENDRLKRLVWAVTIGGLEDGPAGESTVELSAEVVKIIREVEEMRSDTDPKVKEESMDDEDSYQDLSSCDSTVIGDVVCEDMLEEAPHPAVMSHSDPQCHSSSSTTSSPLTTQPRWLTTLLLTIFLLSRFSILTSLSLTVSKRVKTALSSCPATFNCLNTGSHFTGADARGKRSSSSAKLQLKRHVAKAVVHRLGITRMKLASRIPHSPIHFT
jgi:Basic region leucine zipper